MKNTHPKVPSQSASSFAADIQATVAYLPTAKNLLPCLEIDIPAFPDGANSSLSSLSKECSMCMRGSSGNLGNFSPEIEWHKISGLSNILVHDCLTIDIETIWIIVSMQLTTLRNAA